MAFQGATAISAAGLTLDGSAGGAGSVTVIVDDYREDAFRITDSTYGATGGNYGSGDWLTLDTRYQVANMYAFTFDSVNATLTSGSSAIYGLMNFQGHNITINGTTTVEDLLINVKMTNDLSISSDSGNLTINKTAQLAVAPHMKYTNVTILEAAAIRVLDTDGGSTGSLATTQTGIHIENITTGTSVNLGLYIAGASLYSLWVDDGMSRFDGYVAIGTTNATAQLEVYSNDNDEYIAEFHQAHTSNLGSVQIDSPTNSDSRPARLHFTRAGVLHYEIGGKYGFEGFHISDSTASRFAIRNNGNVGINTTNPQATLEAQISDSGTNTVPTVAILSHKTSGNAVDGFGSALLFNLSDAGVSNAGLGYIGIVRNGADYSGKIIFAPNNAGTYNSTAMVITNTGNVGIGISPTSQLHVEGPGGSTDLFTLKNEGSSGKQIDITADNSGVYMDYTGYLYIRPTSSTAKSIQLNASTGQVVLMNNTVAQTITTAPQLFLNGGAVGNNNNWTSIKFATSTSYSNENWYIGAYGHASSNTSRRFSIANYAATEVFTVNYDGNVGIGNVAPGYALVIGTSTETRFTANGIIAANGSNLTLARVSSGQIVVSDSLTFSPHNAASAMVIAAILNTALEPTVCP